MREGDVHEGANSLNSVVKLRVIEEVSLTALMSREPLFASVNTCCWAIHMGRMASHLEDQIGCLSDPRQSFASFSSYVGAGRAHKKAASRLLMLHGVPILPLAPSFKPTAPA